MESRAFSIIIAKGTVSNGSNTGSWDSGLSFRENIPPEGELTRFDWRLRKEHVDCLN